MNEGAFFSYLSHATKAIVKRYDREMHPLDTWSVRQDLRNPLLMPNAFPGELLSQVDSELPTMVLVNGLLLFSVVSLKDGYLIIGPNLPPGDLPVRKKLTGIPLTEDPQRTLVRIPSITYEKLLLTTHNLFHPDPISEFDFYRENALDPSVMERLTRHLHQTQFQASEGGLKHNPYDQEIREQAAISEGNLDALMRSISEEYTGQVGTLAKDPLRQAKNLAIVNTTLASRSAIRGGMSYEAAFSLSDSYIQLFEEMTDVSMITHMRRSMEIQYTEIVAGIRKMQKGQEHGSGHPHVASCKNYIYSHLHSPISVQEIADSLGLNANYLSALFRREEGISLPRYILREKISRCKNMLIYSDSSFLEIAAYLGFSSQSHLGARFKEETGYTLRQFRNTFRAEHF